MYFIEETTDAGYEVLWRGESPQQALSELGSLPGPNRLELWTKAHASSPKGFAPLAFRAANQTKVLTSQTFTFLHLK